MQLTIDGIAYGGKGIARLDGKVLFVADAVPGDLVEVGALSDCGRYGEATMNQLVAPSHLRSPPQCAFATACGGCQWMGISYDQQLAWKQGFVSSALTRIGKLSDDVQVEMIGSPSLYHYRNRILLRVHLSADGELSFGYFRRGSRELVPITGCAIASQAINQCLQALAMTPLPPLPALAFRLELQEMPPMAGKNLLLTVYPGDGPREALTTLLGVLRELPQVYWADLVFALKSAPSVLFDHDLERDFLTVPGQFQQVNLELNRTLRRLVKEHAERVRPERVLDVFCGSGNLSLPLADGVRYVEGIEANKQAIQVARQNAEANLLSNVRYLAGDAEKHLWKVDRGCEPFDLIILDPPRAGMHKGMVPLKNIGASQIIYVSCDPTTLARDLAYLCRKDGYRLTRVVALDFFPNTYHVETVAFLERCQ